MGGTEKAHVLVVHEYDAEEPSDSFDLEHRDDCPTITRHFGDFSYVEHTCHVGEIEADAGLSGFFWHRDDPRPDGRERLAPGRHLIEAWTECTPATYWHGAEWDYGLRLVEAAGAVVS